uniref:Uncharacterized protein n=1 Tax=Medicago truncatula TaxID=3880 RepID=A2Q401_MEDTR|nr:hypothetical protein MtrDRAFT_AC155891g9v1 [Medicago truncatula]
MQTSKPNSEHKVAHNLIFPCLGKEDDPADPYFTL